MILESYGERKGERNYVADIGQRLYGPSFSLVSFDGTFLEGFFKVSIK
jgi:hypothetical protein